MKAIKPLGRWTVRTLRTLTLAGALGATLQLAAAQTPPPIPGVKAPASLPKKIYTKTSEFKLPIQMDEKTRATLDRVCLYVKSENSDWVRQEIGPATLPYFMYRVPQDGEYWFSLTTVDKAGKMSPADVSQEPPSLRVVIDTKAPVVDAQPWISPEGELCLRCNVVDANPDPTTLKVLARLSGGDRPLVPYSAAPGIFKVGTTELQNAALVVTAQDLSGNPTSKEVRLRDLMASAVTAPLSNAAQPPAFPNTVSARVDLPALPQIEPPPMLTPVPPVNMAPTTNSLSPEAPKLPTPPPLNPTQSSAPPSNSPLPPRQEQNIIVPATTYQRPEPEAAPRNLGAPNRQIINTTRAVLDYRIDQVGPSGVGKVDVFMTADQGQTWQRLGEDPDRRSPVEFELPGEGVFGIRLAITNGNGFGGASPARGDAPTCSIEVDTTPPFVQLRPIDPIVSNGALDIRWQASDKNLGTEPVNLYYRNRADGAWQAIARNLRNDGAYRWSFPREAAPQFFLRVEVTDLAGNVSRVETPNPVVLDTTEPRATVLGVSGQSARPGGN